MIYIYGSYNPYHHNENLQSLRMSTNLEDVIDFMKDRIDTKDHESPFLPMGIASFMGSYGKFLRDAYKEIIPEINDLRSDFYKNPNKYRLYHNKIMTCNVSINENINGNKINEIKPCVYINGKFYFTKGYPPFARPEI